MLTAFARLLDEHAAIVLRALRGKSEPKDMARLDEIESHVFAWVEDGDYPADHFYAQQEA